MLSVEEALRSVLADCAPLAAEHVALANVTGRVAAEDIQAKITQPPFAASAMDGFAVRFEDARKGNVLKVIGEAPAGAPFAERVGPGEAVRIFTGGVVPDGAEHIVIQENAERRGDEIIVHESPEAPRHIRPAGVDFSAGDLLVPKGEVLHQLHGSILAAANIDQVNVVRQPTVAIFSNGDELREPGADLATGEIINSNHYALSAMVESWGGAPRYLGCAVDSEAAIEAMFAEAKDADIILPVGGASVGDYDFVKSAFVKGGGEIVFEKVAMKPGKPVWQGRLGGSSIIGLPGNPASALVAASLFVQPLVRRLAGFPVFEQLAFAKGILLGAVPANGRREAFLRAVAEPGADGYRIKLAPNQDSSLLTPFSTANILLRRLAEAPAATAGDEAEFVWLRRPAL